MKTTVQFFAILLVFTVFSCKQKSIKENPATIQESAIEQPDYKIINNLDENKNFPVRGFHIDLRIQVMTLKALKDFAKDLSILGINTLVMEWEGTFPYDKHATISNKHAYTRDEIKDFVNYCEELGIEVIPLQQCFGHAEYILCFDRYAHLREDKWEISQVCPLKEEENKQLFKELFMDIASLHKSDYIHIGCDETYLLGKCKRCATKVEKTSKSQLFVDYVKMMCDIITDMGKTPVLWADIILEHPEAVEDLPENAIFIDWNYGWDINNFGNVENLLNKGCKFWGSPALRSNPDNYYLHSWEKHFNNLRDFIPYSRKVGYTGMVMTSWSTSGGYGFVWDAYSDVAEMHQIRNVYPLSGFRILTVGFAQAMAQKEPVIPEEFVKEYAQERFGINVDESQKLWQVFNIPPYRVVYGKVKLKKKEVGMTISQVLEIVRESKKILDAIIPKYNKKEFAHYKLMTDLREYYFHFKSIEAIIHSDDYNRSMINSILPQLDELFVKLEKLDKTFKELNKGYLYDSELEEEKIIRNRKLEFLRDKVKGVR